MLGDADQGQLDRVVQILQEVLGNAVVGAYLFGSAVLGGLRPRSDLDVLVVTSRRATREEKEHLVEKLIAISGRPSPGGGHWRRVEVTIVVGSEITPWRYPPRMDFQYGDWLHDSFVSGDPEPWQVTENHDLASLVTMTLLADTPLLGRPPAEVLDPVPHHDLHDATVGHVDEIVAGLDDDDTRNVVLTLARIWSTASTGDIRSKDAAADWALARLPEELRPPLARARAVYLGDEEDRWDDLELEVRSYVEAVVVAIRHTAGAEG